MEHDDLSAKVEELSNQVEVLKSGANNAGVGLLQGIVMAVVTWYVLVPIGQWLDNTIYPFHWLIIAINFLAPFGVAATLVESSKETRKARYRFWTYCVVEVAIILLYLVMWPSVIFHP